MELLYKALEVFQEFWITLKSVSSTVLFLGDLDYFIISH